MPKRPISPQPDHPNKRHKRNDDSASNFTLFSASKRLAQKKRDLRDAEMAKDADTNQKSSHNSAPKSSLGVPIRNLTLLPRNPASLKTHFDGTRFYRSRRPKDPVTPDDLSFDEIVPYNRSIRTMWFSSFGCDAKWLMERITAKLPESSTAMRVILILGTKDKAENRTLTAQIRHDLQLVICNTFIKDQYGSMHSKLWLFECESFIRVVVGTANVVPTELEHVVWNQAFWVQDFPKKDVTGKTGTSAFEEDLVAFLKAHETNPALPAEYMRKYDFSDAKAHLICSTPGLHKRDATHTGHRNLHVKLDEGFQKLGANASQMHSKAYVACSSLGYLSDNFMNEFKRSVRVRDLAIIFPTAAFADSIPEYGRDGAGCIFLKKQQYSAKTFPRETFHTYKSYNKMIGHAKICFSLADVTDEDGKQETQAWCVMGSHNLSVAAWGRQQSNGFFVRSYELSVLLPPQRYKCSRKELLDRFGVGFEFPPKKYAPGEEPFMDG